MNKKILAYSFVALAVLGMVGVTTMTINAAKVDNGQISFQRGVGFFNENKGERMQERLLVSGLTQGQIDALIAKKSELREKYATIRELPKEEAREQMQTVREEFMAWAEASGIDAKLLGHGKGAGKGFMGNCPFAK